MKFWCEHFCDDHMAISLWKRIAWRKRLIDIACVNEPLDHLCTITSQCDQMAILFSTFGRLHEWKFSQWHTKFTKVVPKFCQKVNTPLKKSSKTVKILPSGEISPNLVTLLLANNLSGVYTGRFNRRFRRAIRYGQE